MYDSTCTWWCNEGVISLFQVEITLKPRKGHSTTDISISSTLTKVVMFGGCSQFFGVIKLADTVVLQFSEWCAPYSAC